MKKKTAPKASPKKGPARAADKKPHAATMLSHQETLAAAAGVAAMAPSVPPVLQAAVLNDQDAIIGLAPAADTHPAPVTDFFLPDFRWLEPYDHKPKELTNHTQIGGLAGNTDFEQAVVRMAQLSMQKKAIEAAQAELKITLIAHMGIADVSSVAVGRFKVQIVHKSQPSLKRELLLENGVSPEVIEKSTTYTAVEYPLIDDMAKPKKPRGGGQQQEEA